MPGPSMRNECHDRVVEAKNAVVVLETEPLPTAFISLNALHLCREVQNRETILSPMH
jgi:hypothetical protein